MAARSLLRSFPLLRHRLHHNHHHHLLLSATLTPPHRQHASTSSAYSTPSDDTSSDHLSEPPRNPGGAENPNPHREWKEMQREILRDVEGLSLIAKNILHSTRYKDGERLNAEDEKTVLEKLLAYHPNSEDKIGCGLESIMVDRHPVFRNSRCLFVVRTDGGWIDFSYHKCIKAYVQTKFPSHAERFIQDHLK